MNFYRKQYKGPKRVTQKDVIATRKFYAAMSGKTEVTRCCGAEHKLRRGEKVCVDCKEITSTKFI